MSKAEFTEKNEFALRKLVAFVTLSEGFTVGFVESARSEDTDQLIEFLKDHPACGGLEMLVVTCDDPQLQFLLKDMQAKLGERLRETAQEKVVIVRDLEKLIGVENYLPVLVDLNFTRDAYRRKIPYPLIFVLPDYAITQFARFAPDFWAWKSAECKLAAPVTTPETPSLRQLVPDLPTDRKVIPVPPERFTLLNRLLEEDYKEDSQTRADLLLERSRAYQSHSQFKLAKMDAVAALALYETLLEPNHLEIANALYQLVSVRLNLGEFKNLEPLVQRSLTIRQEALGNEHPEVAKSLRSLGNLYLNVGKYRDAITFQQQALDIAKKIGDRSLEANSLGNLGIAYNSLGEYQRAIAFHQQWLDIAREIGDRRGEVASLGSLGNAYQSLGEYQRAISLYEQALSIGESIGDKHGVARNTYNIALTWATLGRKWEAQQNILAAKALYEEMGVKYMIENCEDAFRSILQIVDADVVAPLWELDKPAPRKNLPVQPSFSTSPEQSPTEFKPLPAAFQIPAQKQRRPWWQKLWLKFRRFIHKLFKNDL